MHRQKLAAAVACVGLLMTAAPAHAATYTSVVQPDTSGSRATHVREDSPDNNYSTRNDLRLRAAQFGDDKNRNILLDPVLPDLTGRSVLRAWLELRQSAGTPDLQIEAAVHPLSESYTFREVTWFERAAGQPWLVAGGTRVPSPTDRVPIATAAPGTARRWQIGPILQAWHLGDLPKHGLIVTTGPAAAEAELAFHSSVATAGNRPAWIVEYTDEPPAVRTGFAETDPETLDVASVRARLRVWVNADAAGATPSGAATGFDQLSIDHGGALQVLSVDSLWVNGAAQPVSGVTLATTDTTAVLGLPRVETQARVRLDLSVAVPPGTPAQRVPLRMEVDDTLTPGAGPQSLWPAEANGVPSDGDGALVTLAPTPVTRIELSPSALVIPQLACTTLTVIGYDAGGDQVAVTVDSLRLMPPTLGDVSPALEFCAGTVPGGQIIAISGVHRDTLSVTIGQRVLPVVSGVQLTTPGGSPASALVPGDTLLVNAQVAHAGGFQSVRSLEFGLSLAGHENDTSAPAYRALLGWRRQGSSGWQLSDPIGTSWAVFPSLCAIDSLTDSTQPVPVTLALRVGAIARASATGEWSVRLVAYGQTQADTGSFLLSGTSCERRVTLAALADSAAFAPDRPGALAVPVANPGDGHVPLTVLSNTDFQIGLAGEDLVGRTNPAESIPLSASPVRWALQDDGLGGGPLGADFVPIGPPMPAAVVDSAQVALIHLWIDHPAVIAAQSYAGTLRARVSTPDFPAAMDSVRVPMIATVVSAGFAADSARAEVAPRRVVAGTPAQPFAAGLLLQGGGTGANDVNVDLPSGYGAPRVDSVHVSGASVAFADRSTAAMARARLAANAPPGSAVTVYLAADVTTVANATGHAFVVSFDDTATSVPAQVADPGDVLPEPGGGWTVAVDPGPAVTLEIQPFEVVAFVDSTVHCSAAVADAFGNPVAAGVQWSTVGGVGAVVSTTGDFIGVAPGTGLVIARAAGLADSVTARVLLLRGFAARSVQGPALVHQGQTRVTFATRLENLGAEPIRIDSLRLVFSRLASGDADGDFTIHPALSLPADLPVGAVVSIPLEADVADAAAPGPVTVGAQAWGQATGSGAWVSDLSVDTARVISVTSAGLVMSGYQSGGAIRPGTGEAVVLELRIDNRYPDNRSLTRLVLANRTTGSGTADDHDEALGTVRLYLDDGDGAFEAAGDSLVRSTLAITGAVAFEPVDIPVPANGGAALWVTAAVPLQARDGDLLDLEVADAAGVAAEPASLFRNSWPVSPAGGFALDGFVADAAPLTPVPAGSLVPGGVRQGVLNLRLPANGYQADVLQRLAVTNLGTAIAVRDLSVVEAWVDDGDGQFDPARERRLGALVHTGDRWELSGLAEPVGLAGLPLHVSVDVSPTAVEGTTVRFELPGEPYVGAGMASGNDGPLDRGVANPHAQTVSPAERVLFTAVPGDPAAVRPGQSGFPLLHFTAANGLPSPRTLRTLVFRNATSGSGTVAQLDAAFRRLELRFDGDGDGALGDPVVDPLLGAGSFSAGEASFDGLSLVIPAGATAGFFLTGEISLALASDGDVLAADLEGPESIRFEEAAALNGAWPLDGGARAIVDGLVADQVTPFVVPHRTVGRNAVRVLALDIGVPANGYREDILRGLRLVNRGSALPSDIASLELWVDGGDGAFTASGDDTLLGPLAFLGGEWTSPSLALAIGPGGRRMFASLTPSPGAGDSATVRLDVPVQGLTYESAQDGPLDRAVAATGTITISGLPLLAHLETPVASVVGQAVQAVMVVTNDSDEAILGVTPSPLAAAGDGGMTPVSGPLPASFDLAPAEADTFRWQYVAAAVGRVTLRGEASGTGAVSSLERRSLVAESADHRIYDVANVAWLEPVQTMPASVNRGQSGVVPLSLTLTNPGGADVSELRVRRMRVRLVDEGGNGIVPADLLTRVEVHEGTSIYLSKTALETSGSEVDLPFALPVTVANSQPTTLTLRIDVSPNATVPGFRLVMTDSTAWQAEDATSGAPAVVRLETGAYPLESRLARVVDEATTLLVDTLATPDLTAGRGAANVRLARLRLVNPGIPGVTSDVRLTEVGLTFTDDTGDPLANPGSVVRQLHIASGGQTLGSRWIGPADSAEVRVGLSLPLNIPAGAPASVEVLVDVAPDADLIRMRARWPAAPPFQAHDENSHDPVAVSAARDPLDGPLLAIQAPAETLLARGEALLPATTTVGQRDVPALRAILRHPGGTGVAGITVDSLEIVLRDELRRTLAPGVYLSGVEARWNGAVVARTTVPLSVAAPFALPVPGSSVAAGDSGVLEIRIDLASSAPLGFVELAIAASGVRGKDANTGSPVLLLPAPGAELPLVSGLTRIQSPSRLLLAGLASLIPVSVAPDGVVVPAGRLELANADSLASGAIQIESLRIQAADRGFATLPIGAVAERLEAWRGGTLWAVSAALSPDSTLATLRGAAAIAVAPREVVPIELRFVPRAGLRDRSVRLGVDAAGIGVVQPGSALLAVSVLARPGSSFPLWTDAAGLESTDLAESYANYPNPFSPGRGGTTFVFNLNRSAHVTLRVLTPLGEPVATLLDDAPRGPGLQQGDRWDGRTERGSVVYNGVYVAELVVRYDDGERRRVLRKLAVAR